MGAIILPCTLLGVMIVIVYVIYNDDHFMF